MPTEVHLVKAMVFPVVTYRCESWTIKKAECQRTDVFKLWCWRRLLRVPWNKPVNPKGNQCWIFIGKTDADAEAESWYFGHLMWRVDLFEKTLMLGKTEGKRRRVQQRMRWLHSITDSVDMNLRKLWETVKDRGAWDATVHEVAKSWIWLSDWTTNIFL